MYVRGTVFMPSILQNSKHFKMLMSASCKRQLRYVPLIEDKMATGKW